jgi:hypothetical protein
VSLHKNRPNYGSNADRPHNRDEPPRGNRGPGHHAERTRRTYNQREQTIAFVTKILYDLFPLQRPKIHELIELTASKILNTRTRINHTGQRIYFTFE